MPHFYNNFFYKIIFVASIIHKFFNKREQKLRQLFVIIVITIIFIIAIINFQSVIAELLLLAVS